jgi:hypothetical protein
MKKAGFLIMAIAIGAALLGCPSPANTGDDTETIGAAAVSGLIAPAAGAVPVTVSALSAETSGYTVQSIGWEPAVNGAFAADTEYQAVITLKATPGFRFAGAISPAVDAGTAGAGTISGTGAENTLSFRVSFPRTGPDPVYGIALGDTGDGLVSFPAATAGYGAQTAKSVTISNTGNQPTGDLTVALSGTNSGSFTLNKTTITTISVSGTDSFTVVPNTGLGAGTYTATVTVSGGNGITADFDVSFTVNPQHISAVTVTGLVIPVTGAAPGTAGSLSGGTGYTIQSIGWTTGGAAVTGTFAAATSYRASIVLKAGANYQFTGDITPTMNAGSPSAGTIAGDGPGNTLTFTVDFPATTGLGGITITAWVNEDGSLITGPAENITLSRSAGSSLTVQAAAGLTDVQWTLNGIDIPAPRGTAQSISFGAVNYPAGNYNLGLRVTKGGAPYSVEIEFTVTE